MDIEHLKADMTAVGLPCNAPIIIDAKIHRFNQQSDKDKPCWYWLCFISQNVVFGYFGCWKRGIKKKWCSKNSSYLNASEKAELKTANTKYSETLRQARQNAKQRAQTIWNKSLQNFETHLYLQHKGVKNFGIRLYKGLLVIPLQNSDDEICSLQFISSDSTKRFLADGQTKGCYFVVGSIDKITSEQALLYIAEGYATAATIHEATGCTVIAAFYAGNLLPVAQIMRKKCPTNEIIICADDDQY